MYPDGFDIKTAKSAAEHVMQAYALYESPSARPATVNGYKLSTLFFDQDGPKQRRMGYIATKGAETVISIRGTENLSDWRSDLHGTKSEAPKFYTGMKAHTGFLTRYLLFAEGVRKVVDGLRTAGAAKKILVTGHSLGGALAKLCALDLRAEDHKDVTLYTFGAPKVWADAAIAKKFRAICPKSYRVVNPHDLVPRSPPGFAHHDGEWTIPEAFGKDGAVEAHVMASYTEIVSEYAKTR